MAVVKFARSGKGDGRGVVAYLVEKERNIEAEVFRGNATITESLIASSPHEYTYDHAIISFSDDDSASWRGPISTTSSSASRISPSPASKRTRSTPSGCSTTTRAGRSFTR